jgi:hypothetical protein
LLAVRKGKVAYGFVPLDFAARTHAGKPTVAVIERSILEKVDEMCV